MSWLGFAAGLAPLALTWSSVVKTLLIPGYWPSKISVALPQRPVNREPGRFLA